MSKGLVLGQKRLLRTEATQTVEKLVAEARRRAGWRQVPGCRAEKVTPPGHPSSDTLPLGLCIHQDLYLQVTFCTGFLQLGPVSSQGGT